MLAALLTLTAAQVSLPAPVTSGLPARLRYGPDGTPPAPCTGPGKLPPELAGWASPRAIAAATTPQELGSATLASGAGARATLSPTPRIAYPVQPAHPGNATTYGGLFAFTISEAGNYRIALSGPAWVDTVADGQALPSTAHGHGPDCTGIRKQVDFALKPGRYLLELSGATEPVTELMVARLPG